MHNPFRPSALQLRFFDQLDCILERRPTCATWSTLPRTSTGPSSHPLGARQRRSYDIGMRSPSPHGLWKNQELSIVATNGIGTTRSSRRVVFPPVGVARLCQNLKAPRSREVARRIWINRPSAHTSLQPTSSTRSRGAGDIRFGIPSCGCDGTHRLFPTSKAAYVLCIERRPSSGEHQDSVPRRWIRQRDSSYHPHRMLERALQAIWYHFP